MNLMQCFHRNDDSKKIENNLMNSLSDPDAAVFLSLVFII